MAPISLQMWRIRTALAAAGLWTASNAASAIGGGSLAKLKLSNESVINGFGIPLGGGGLGDCYFLLDEQDAAGDPANGHPGHVKTQWVR